MATYTQRCIHKKTTRRKTTKSTKDPHTYTQHTHSTLWYTTATSPTVAATYTKEPNPNEAHLYTTYALYALVYDCNTSSSCGTPSSCTNCSPETWSKTKRESATQAFATTGGSPLESMATPLRMPPRDAIVCLLGMSYAQLESAMSASSCVFMSYVCWKVCICMMMCVCICMMMMCVYMYDDDVCLYV